MKILMNIVSGIINIVNGVSGRVVGSARGMQRKVLSRILILSVTMVAFVMPQLACAVDFVPTRDDLSVVLLKRIFGTVGGGLEGASATIFGQVFYVFNCGLLMVVGLILSYTIFRSIMEIAQANVGQMGGKFSWWQPIRVVTGIGLLVPQATGYSVLNSIVMGVVIQGIGLADGVWFQAVDYIMKGGTLYVPITSSASGSNFGNEIDTALIYVTTKPKFATSSDILRSQICMNTLYNVVEESRKSRVDAIKNDPAFDAETKNAKLKDLSAAIPMFREDYKGGVAIFPGNADKVLPPPSDVPLPPGQTINLNGECGSYKWDLVPASDREGPAEYKAVKETGLRQMILGLGPLAYASVNNYQDSSGVPKSTTDFPTSFHEQVYTALVTAVANYQSIIYPMRVLAGNLYQKREDKLTDPGAKLAELTKDGWISAGSFYFTLARISEKDTAQKFDADYYGPSVINTPPICVYDASKTLVCNDRHAAIATYIGKYLPNASKQATYKKYFQDRIVWQTKLNGGDASVVYSLANDLAKTLNTKAQVGSVDLPAELAAFAKNYQSSLYVKTGVIGDAALAVMAPISPTNLVFNALGKIFPQLGFLSGGVMTAANLVVLFPLNLSLSAVFHEWYSLFFEQPNTVFPLIKLRNLGLRMINETLSFWQAVFDQFGILATVYLNIQVGGFVIDSGLSFIPAPFGMPFQTLLQGARDLLQQVLHLFFEIPLMVVLPIGFAVSLLLLTNGVILAYYLPLLPFMLFLFGVISWLAFVVEGMVAAPLVALGVTHPEGHDLMGKSEQTLMLLLSIFIRPTAMIIGLLVSMALSYVAIDVLNAGFKRIIDEIYFSGALGAQLKSAADFNVTNAITAIKGGATDITGVGFGMSGLEQIRNVAMILIYTLIVMALTNQCYALIHDLPAYIMQWIGGVHREDKAGAMAKEVQGGVSQTSEKVGGSVSASSMIPSSKTTPGMKKGEGGAGSTGSHIGTSGAPSSTPPQAPTTGSLESGGGGGGGG